MKKHRNKEQNKNRKEGKEGRTDRKTEQINQ